MWSQTRYLHKSGGMGKRLILAMLLAGASLVPTMAAADAVCDDADHCVWIMENHGPHEFDYEILTRELEGFGADGKEFLIMLVGDKDPDIAGRAIDILYGGKFDFTREEARLIVNEWPGSNVDKMANLMVKVGSPDVQGRMIESLLRDDQKIQSVARDVLSRLREKKKIYQLRAFEYGPLAKAVSEQPTRELVQMLSAFSPEKTRPFLQKAIGASDGPSVIAAYEGLYEIDKELAFRTLLTTLNNLKHDQSDTAFAIGELLRHRHALRSDGFYMQFAKELAEDPEMSLMGRVAGLDAVLGGGAFKTDGKVLTLETTDPVRSALLAALTARGDNIYPYDANFSRVFTNDPGHAAMMIWKHIQENQQQDGRIYQSFFQQLDGLKGNAQASITLQALGQGDNIKILEYALASVRSQEDDIYLTSVSRLSGHWADDIRHQAISTAKILNAPAQDKNKEIVTPVSFRKSINQLRTADKKRWSNCKMKSAAVTDYVVQLPYFTLEEEVTGSFVKRRFIKAAYPTQDGWFVGFKNSGSGDLWYFDNESGLGDPVKGDQMSGVSAVMPMRLPDAGRYTSDFWVISADPNDPKSGQLFRASQNSLGIDAKLHRYLPRADFNVSILPGNAYLLSHKNHAPLILKLDGTIKPACE